MSWMEYCIVAHSTHVCQCLSSAHQWNAFFFVFSVLATGSELPFPAPFPSTTHCSLSLVCSPLFLSHICITHPACQLSTDDFSLSRKFHIPTMRDGRWKRKKKNLGVPQTEKLFSSFFLSISTLLGAAAVDRVAQRLLLLLHSSIIASSEFAPCPYHASDINQRRSLSLASTLALLLVLYFFVLRIARYLRLLSTASTTDPTSSSSLSRFALL
jgi:hypothetical protein